MLPCFLTLPAEGDRTLARIDRKVRLLAARHLLTLRGPGPLPAVQRVLSELLRAEPDRTLDAIGAPDVLPLLLAAMAHARPPLADLDAAVANLLVHLGHTPEAVLWDRPLPAVTDGARTWRFDPPATGLSVDPAGVSVRTADGRLVGLHDLPATDTTAPIAAGVHLGLADTFPLSLLEDHPDKAGNALDLGDRPATDWTEALADALSLVSAGLPAWHAELPLALSRLVPVGWEPERHLSASYREAPGIAWLTLHPDPLTLAEAIVHETQHGKLNRLTWLDPVLHNGRTTWTSSPVRPDLRPLIGVLLAVHAFVPVAALHVALADHRWPDPDRFARRRAEVLASNARGLAVLEEKSEPSNAGRRLLAELRALHDATVAATPATG